ncbi:conserved Plasmodium protein, unknown function [Plasmodium ovale wallikeri]|uniref:Uncharacterized protein n=1 Tax=Plasmodium ovale wallikeri TaxID=864142 RepID=A0A1A8YQV5_PLAOA|nr:conserved Plasmodium protein, unknown function [Plasmodium ovale wallikeri]SBT34008.1 conserved Plasmodium protein, unknown function [Plasmodium ovale wallikeri]
MTSVSGKTRYSILARIPHTSVSQAWLPSDRCTSCGSRYCVSLQGEGWLQTNNWKVRNEDAIIEYTGKDSCREPVRSGQ